MSTITIVMTPVNGRSTVYAMMGLERAATGGMMTTEAFTVMTMIIMAMATIMKAMMLFLLLYATRERTAQTVVAQKLLQKR